MIWLWLAVAIPALIFVAVEIVLRRRNPYRLWSAAFDEASATEPHTSRGWAPKPYQDFTFHHRYLPGPNRVHLNNAGMHDARDYERTKAVDTTRIMLFGGTTSVGYEMPAPSTVAAQLQSSLSRTSPHIRFEVMNAACRNYSTGQLYEWYVGELAEYTPDAIVYYFNTNHPRRNVTFHESGKPVALHQPVYVLEPDGTMRLTHTGAPEHLNDMIFLNDGFGIERIPGRTDRSAHKWLRDNLHTYCALEEAILGSVRLRPFKDRTEIKDIEKVHFTSEEPESVDSLPYMWRVTAGILAEWVDAARAGGSQFLIVSHLAYYHAGEGRLSAGSDHPWGFDFDDIPERRYLPFIAQMLDVPYFDTYAYARERKTDTGGFYVHPRYAYLNEKGAAFHARAIHDALDQHGLVQSAEAKIGAHPA